MAVARLGFFFNSAFLWATSRIFQADALGFCSAVGLAKLPAGARASRRIRNLKRAGLFRRGRDGHVHRLHFEPALKFMN